MTDEQIQQFADYVKQYAELFGVDRHYLVVDYDPASTMQASANHHRDYLYARISLGPNQKANPFPDLEVTAAHELIHVVANDLRQWMYQTVSRYLKKKDATVLLDQFEHYDERITEVLARGIVAARRGESNPGRFRVERGEAS